jgi:hypothetical protein
MSEMKTYHGGCHCGAVRYEATTDLSSMIDCNCSRCRRLGAVLQGVDSGHFRLLGGEDALTTYRFNTHRIEHLFCRECGIESFARAKGDDGEYGYMINVNCLDDGPDVDRATIVHWDGRSA